MVDIDLPIPNLLLDLVERGIWPADSEQSERFEMAYAPNGPQHDTVEAQRKRLTDYGPPRVPVDRIRLIYPGQCVLCLYPPPSGVRTVRPQARHWGMFEGFLVEHEIDRTRLLQIGDFGWGSDCVIILDYQMDLQRPTVCRLTPQVGSPDPDGYYRYKIASIEIAPSFDEFARPDLRSGG